MAAKGEEEMNKITINIRLISGIKFSTSVDCSATTVGSLKEWLHTEHSCPPVQNMRLIYKGRILHDDAVFLSAAGVVANGCTLFLVTMGGGMNTNFNTNSNANTSANSATEMAAPNNNNADSSSSSSSMLQLMTESNPALRELSEANPTIRHLLSDPAVMRDMLNSATNPHARAQQERAHDLQLAQIENMPGGMAALRTRSSQQHNITISTTKQL